MNYVFVFVGEFGFELLNWQGMVRKFRETLQTGDKIVCCSRANVYPLYEFCDAYVDIAAVPMFQHSRSLAYFAVPATAASGWDTLSARRFNQELKASLRVFILDRLYEQGVLTDADQALRFIFSSDHTELHNIGFGRRRRGQVGLVLATLLEQCRAMMPRSGAMDCVSWEGVNKRFFAMTKGVPALRALDHTKAASIYDLPGLSDNTYVRIQPDFTLIKEVQKKLGWDPLGEAFVLCQTRQRPIYRLSPEPLPWVAIRSLLARLATEMKIVLISFQTGRALDSYSAFGAIENCQTYACQTFPEQGLLIHFASHCLFFTEGDFGSHIYVPPLMGKDVTVLAAASMYALPTAPIASWNEHVFRFGGQILPRTTEATFATPQATEALRRDIAVRVRTRPPVSSPPNDQPLTPR